MRSVPCRIHNSIVAVMVITLVKLNKSESICPYQCYCDLDDSGRRQVVCIEGGMRSPIPVHQMNKETEVIIISAPENNQNYLTIGPIFQQFKKLEELHIVGSNIPTIGKHSFWGVPSIQILNLTHNNITNIYDHNFIGMANLVELHLSDNRVGSLASATFQHLSELRILTLARNQITELVPRLFLKLGKLKVLDLSGNPLKELTPEVFMDIQELRTLRCRYCQLRSMNTQIYHLQPYLLQLDLGDNEFKYISHDEFIDLRRLKQLWLDGNQLPVVLENTFGKQHELESLSLARNRLAKITNTAFTNLTSLRVLDISYNKLHRLDTESFHPIADSLQHLNLSGNHLAIGELKYVLQVVTKIRELGLAHMNLSDLPLGLLFYQENLVKLNLSHNNFAHFPVQVLSPVPKLYEIDLSSNRFRGLDENFIARLTEIPIVHLQNNSWTCDLCHIRGMLSDTASVKLKKQVEQQNGGKAVDVSLVNKLQCTAPSKLVGRTISSLKSEELDWCSMRGYSEDNYNDKKSGVRSFTHNFLGENGHIGILAACGTSVFLVVTGIVLTVAMCYSRRRAANLYTSEEKRGPENEKIFENASVILSSTTDINFKFPLDINHIKNQVSISTIDEIKKDPQHFIASS